MALTVVDIFAVEDVRPLLLAFVLPSAMDATFPVGLRAQQHKHRCRARARLCCAIRLVELDAAQRLETSLAASLMQQWMRDTLREHDEARGRSLRVQQQLRRMRQGATPEVVAALNALAPLVASIML
jgi:hypothetical protein